MSELFSLNIEYLPNCYSVSCSPFSFLTPDWTFTEHLSRALPTEKIFYLLRSIRSDCLMRDYTAKMKLATLEIIIKWLQVSVSECSRQTLGLNFDLCLGTWFRATERLVRSLPG